PHLRSSQRSPVCSLSNDPSTPAIYPLSLHDALPIWAVPVTLHHLRALDAELADLAGRQDVAILVLDAGIGGGHRQADRTVVRGRSEEHTSELQSRENLVCRLLLEKKKSSRI